MSPQNFHIEPLLWLHLGWKILSFSKMPTHFWPPALFSTYANTYFDKNQAICNVTINLQHMRGIESATMPYKKEINWCNLVKIKYYDLHSIRYNTYIIPPTTDVWRLCTSQNLYGQYHSWDLYVLGLKTKVFCRKNNQVHFPMDTVPK